MVTARDVAKRAGVSQATVSYVMSGSRPISEATKKRVRKAMDELGYVPNINARSLAGGKVGVIGVLVHMDENTDLAELRPFLVVIMEEARKRGSSVMLVPADEGIEGLCRMVRQGVVDGVLVFDVEWHDERLPEIARLDIPVVLVGTPETHMACRALMWIIVEWRRWPSIVWRNEGRSGWSLLGTGEEVSTVMRLLSSSPANLVWWLKCWAWNMRYSSA